MPFVPEEFQKHSLRAHLRNHTNEKIFECTECLQKFARRHNLKNHVITKHAKVGDKEKKNMLRKMLNNQNPNISVGHVENYWPKSE